MQREWVTTATLVKQSTWDAPMPLGRVQGFTHLFGGVVPRPDSSGGGELATSWVVLSVIGPLASLLVAAFAGGASALVSVTALSVGTMFVGLFIVGRFGWAPTILRMRPIIALAWAGALLVGGALGWGRRWLRTEVCLSEVAALTAISANGELTYEKQGLSALEDLDSRAGRAGLICERVGLDGKVKTAQAIAEQTRPGRREIARGHVGDRQLASTPTSTGASPIDPATCPKGKVLLDLKRGVAITCTGPGATLTGASPEANASRLSVYSKFACKDGHSLLKELRLTMPCASAQDWIVCPGAMNDDAANAEIRGTGCVASLGDNDRGLAFCCPAVVAP